MDYSKYINPGSEPIKPKQPSVPDSIEPIDFRNYAKRLEEYHHKMDIYENDIHVYQRNENACRENFREDALEEVGLTGHEAADKAFSSAWRSGHSGGYSEIMSHLIEIAEVILGSTTSVPPPKNSMRDKILARIEEIKIDHKGFPFTNMRWENIYSIYDDKHISLVNFTDLDDDDLLRLYEIIIRRISTQM